MEGFLPEQSFLPSDEQIIDIPVPGAGFQAAEVFKVFTQDKVRCSTLTSSSSTFLFPVEALISLYGSSIRSFYPRSKKVLRSPGVRVRGCTRTRAHPRRRFSGRPLRWPVTSTTSNAMGAGRGASGTTLDSGIAGGWSLKTGPGWAWSYGGLHGLPVGGGGGEGRGGDHAA